MPSHWKFSTDKRKTKILKKKKSSPHAKLYQKQSTDPTQPPSKFQLNYSHILKTQSSTSQGKKQTKIQAN